MNGSDFYTWPKSFCKSFNWNTSTTGQFHSWFYGGHEFLAFCVKALFLPSEILDNLIFTFFKANTSAKAFSLENEGCHSW